MESFMEGMVLNLIWRYVEDLRREEIFPNGIRGPFSKQKESEFREQKDVELG